MTTSDGARCAGAILGLALGDALGFVVEAEPPSTARAYVDDVLRRGRAGERRHPAWPFGQYSDDTQLARELLVSLSDTGRWSPERFGTRVGALVLAGMDVGAGPGTRTAAHRILLGAPWAQSGIAPPYTGNGAAMRVAPIGALFAADPPHRTRVAREQARVTHRDPRCVAGAVVIAEAAALATVPGPIAPREFLARVATAAEAEDGRVGLAIRGVEAWLAHAPADAMLRLQRSGLDPVSAGEWLGISAHVVPSVAWSLYAFLRSPDDWWEAVCTAILPGGDTDTMAAMTGGIAGARLGAASLPQDLLELLNDRGGWRAEALGDLARRCASACARHSTPMGRVL